MLEITALIRPLSLEKFCSVLGKFNVPEIAVADSVKREFIKIACDRDILKDFVKCTRLVVGFNLEMENSGRVLKKIIAGTVKGDFGESKLFIKSYPEGLSHY